MIHAINTPPPPFFPSFITTVGGTANAVAVWRYLAAPVKSIDLVIEGE